MPAFESTEQVDQVMEGDQIQALWSEIHRLQEEFAVLFDLLSIPGGPGPIQIRNARAIAEKEKGA